MRTRSPWEWNQECFLHFPLSVRLLRVDELTWARAERIGKSLEPLSLLDAAYQLGLIYTSLLPNDFRERCGIYYTPPALAERLVDQAEQAGVDWKICRVVDPAAGGGAFLLPVAMRLFRALRSCKSETVIQSVVGRLQGYETDAYGAWLSQVFLQLAAARLLNANVGRIPPVIRVCNSLIDIPHQPCFDLVIGNPPFGRLRLPESLRRRYARGLYGHANLYGMFIDLGVRLTKPGGLISLLTPASFLAGEYFKNLRAILWRDAPPILIDLVDARKGVFDGVLQETVLATYRRNASREQVLTHVLSIPEATTIKLELTGRFKLPKESSAPWILPRDPGQVRLAKRLRDLPDRLADWGYRVSTGPLVWNRHKAQLRHSNGSRCVPLIWAECVTADGNFVFRSDKKNHQPYFELGSNDHWLVISKPCVLVQRTTAKEQARRLIAAELPSEFLVKHAAVTVENHLNMLIPIVEVPAIPPPLLAAVLNSRAADLAFRCLSGSVAVSAYELEGLPLPSAEALKARCNLSDRESVEQACCELFGVYHSS